MPVRHSGFPSPATDYMGTGIDLNELMIENPSATYFMKAEGIEMTGDFVAPDSLLVVDRSETVCNNALVIAVVDGEMLVRKYLAPKGLRPMLVSNPRQGKPGRPITVDNSEAVEIWGVVVKIIIDPKIVLLYDSLS